MNIYMFLALILIGVSSLFIEKEGLRYLGIAFFALLLMAFSLDYGIKKGITSGIEEGITQEAERTTIQSGYFEDLNEDGLKDVVYTMNSGEKGVLLAQPDKTLLDLDQVQENASQELKEVYTAIKNRINKDPINKQSEAEEIN
tara:strand:+ start:4915 stop:5343 length:429 start_codon:yes stop_codon:yes gene_type:complete